MEVAAASIFGSGSSSFRSLSFSATGTAPPPENQQTAALLCFTKQAKERSRSQLTPALLSLPLSASLLGDLKGRGTENRVEENFLWTLSSQLFQSFEHNNSLAQLNYINT